MDLKVILDQVRSDEDWIGLREIRTDGQGLSYRNGKYDSSSKGIDHGVAVEVLKNKHSAYACTSDLSLTGIKAAVEKARGLIATSGEYRLFDLEQTTRPSSVHRDISRKKRHSILQQDFFDLLQSSCEKLKVNSKIINCESQLDYNFVTTRFVSTSGADFFQEQELIVYDLLATAENSGEVQSRSLGGPCYQGDIVDFLRQDLNSEAIRIGEQAIELTSAENCPEGAMDLLLMPDQLYLQVHESIGHPLELDRILGDERNYAGWSFVKPADFGKLQYGSSLLNVVFDPHEKGEFASYQFDDTGTEARREYLIKEGILLRGLGGLESQGRSSIAGVASSRASSWNRPPIDRMANINIEPGSSSIQEMIESMDFGIIMETNKSWSIDDYRNKFQFGCEYGQIVKEGKIAKTVKNPNYRGITNPFWNGLKKVGNQATYKLWGSPYCGKGEPNQAIRVGHATPACLFQDIEVFGGA